MAKPLSTTGVKYKCKGPYTLQRFFEKNRWENRSHYIKLLKKLLQLGYKNGNVYGR